MQEHETQVVFEHKESSILTETEHRQRLAYALNTAVSYRGESFKHIAKELKVSPNTVTRWGRGTSSPDAYNVYRLSQMLGFKPDFFIEPLPVPQYPIEEYLISKEQTVK